MTRLLVKIGAVLAGLALLWTLGIGWALPRLLQPRIEAAATTALGAPLAIDKLEIAPWSLEAKVSGLRLGPVEAPWLKVTEVLADVSIASVWRMAPVLDRLRVFEPVVEIERLDATRFNVSPMLDALGRRPAAPPDAQPARFALNNLSLEGGRIHFIDRVTRTEHHIDALKIGVPFISNLPADVALDVEPLLDATINGSRLTAHGKTLPFQEGLRSSIEVDWKQLDVAAWFAALTPLMSQKPLVTLDQGRLDLSLQIDFERRTSPQVPSVRVRGALLLSQLKASMPAKSTSLAWERLEVTGLDLRPLEQQARIGQVRLQAPVLDLDLPRWLAPDPQAASVPPEAVVAAAQAPASTPASAPGAPAGKVAPWQWAVDDVALVDGRVALQHPGWPKAQALTVPAIEVKGLDSRPDAAPATLALQLADERAGNFKVDGTLGVAARQALLKADLAGLKLVPWLAPWQALLPVDLLDASLAVQAQAEAGPAGWAIDKTAVQLTGLQLQPRTAAGGAPRTGVDKLSLPRLAVEGLQVRSIVGQPMAVDVALVQLENLDLHGARDERGALGWLLAQAQSQAAAPAPAPATAAPALQWRVDELRCTGCSVAMSDLRVTPAVQLAITRTDLTLRALSADLGKPVGFELVTFAGRSGKGGKLQLRGEVRPQPLSVKTRLDLDALDLSFLQAYLDPVANLTLISAKASAAGDLRLEGTAQHAVSDLRWTGRFALGELRALDKINEAELLRFKQLSLDAMDVAWKPDSLQLDLGNVALEDFYGRVIVNADGRINLRDVAKRGGEDRSLTTPTTTPDDAAAAAPQAAPEAPAAAAESTDSPPQLRWRSIRLAGGEINFTDNFIRPNYSARLTDIAGTVSALAWNDTESAKVQISGKVDGSAPLEISGTMHPLGPRLATDITASARGVDITRLTAYSGRYAGYGIEKGTLSVKLHYKIVDGKLEAENNIYLDQLTFGDKVDSPDALKLPVLLAVALLKDRNGVIDINLPISGSLDDPKFSVGAIVVRVIVNLITKAITAPFSLLASAFGGGGEELGYVEFDPGSSVLSEASTKRLDTLAKALLDRPALKLEVTGRADAAQDEAVLREQYLDSLMRTAKAKSSGDLPDSVKIEPADRERWLTAAYKAADLKTKPRNALGLAKSLPPAEMEALLLASAPAGDPELLALADTRGNRVKAYLTTKVPPEQVQLTASKLGAEGLPDKGRTTRAAFALK